MKYKLITSDLDETLLDDEKHVGLKTRTAIAEAKKLGIYFVPNSGRGFALIRQTLNELAVLNKANEYVISYNGSVITENKNDYILKQILMNFEEMNTLFKIGVKNHTPMHIYTLDDIYVYHLDEDEKIYLNRMGFRYHDFEHSSLESLRQQPLVKILFKDKERSNLDDLYSQVPDSIIKDTTVTYSSNRYMELNKVGVNKGKGLLELADYLHIKPQEIIAIGDNHNDLSMIRVAGLGVAVNNAIPEVKDAANYVTSNDNNHDAVAEVIKKFVLNQE